MQSSELFHAPDELATEFLGGCGLLILLLLLAVVGLLAGQPLTRLIVEVVIGSIDEFYQPFYDQHRLDFIPVLILGWVALLTLFWAYIHLRHYAIKRKKSSLRNAAIFFVLTLGMAGLGIFFTYHANHHILADLRLAQAGEHGVIQTDLRVLDIDTREARRRGRRRPRGVTRHIRMSPHHPWRLITPFTPQSILASEIYFAIHEARIQADGNPEPQPVRFYYMPNTRTIFRLVVVGG